MYERTIYEADPDGRGYYRSSDLQRIIAKIETAYLGPWCPNCGKKGTKCRNQEACRVRAITSRPGPKYVTLNYPPDEWMASRGYGRFTSSYYAGGRWKSGGKPKLVHYLSPAQMKNAIQHYAYESAMGLTSAAEARAA